MLWANGPAFSGKCGHCQDTVFFLDPVWSVISNGIASEFNAALQRLNVFMPIRPGSNSRDPKYHGYAIHAAYCPSCKKPSLILAELNERLDTLEEQVLWPIFTERPIPIEVIQDNSSIAKDYQEAVAVLQTSPKASAALSRRCLETVLIEKGGASQRTLEQKILAVINTLPSHLAEQLDAVRNVGNFAAHPMKSQSTGMIVDVEPLEAEWNLDVLDLLFDFYFVQPAAASKKRAELNSKLADAGKKDMH